MKYFIIATLTLFTTFGSFAQDVNDLSKKELRIAYQVLSNEKETLLKQNEALENSISDVKSLIEEKTLDIYKKFDSLATIRNDFNAMAVKIDTFATDHAKIEKLNDSIINIKKNTNQLWKSVGWDKIFLLNNFLGVWFADNARGQFELEIHLNTTVTLKNSACTTNLYWKLKDNELRLFYNGSQCKFKTKDQANIDFEVGRIHLDENKNLSFEILEGIFKSFNNQDFGLLNFSEQNTEFTRE
ncbi:hypothetical protein N9901_01320 [Flavobacteriaceae bacterium]|nr:hypothetical protein [Flavobacteriaceae bacterium]